MRRSSRWSGRTSSLAVFPVAAASPRDALRLGLTVWAIYLTDRLLDVRRPSRESETPRHDFYRRHQRGAQILLSLVVIADLMVAAFWLLPRLSSTEV